MESSQHWPLPYLTDNQLWFSHLADQPWSVLLSSGYPHYQGYDIALWAPDCTLVYHQGISTLTNDQQQHCYPQPPWSLLDKLTLSRQRSNLPFNGGLVGYSSFDLGYESFRLAYPDRCHSANLPALAVGRYSQAIVVDHRHQTSWYVAPVDNPYYRQQWQWCQQIMQHPTIKTAMPWRAHGELNQAFSTTGYRHAFEQVQRYLQQGDCYQVNLTQQFSLQGSGKGWDLFCRLQEDNPAPYSAYMHYPFGEIISSSPEQFLQVTPHGQVSTRPIKGTCRRDLNDSNNDQRQAQQLQKDGKNRTENVIIVDLLRNDLGQLCQSGSVKVQQLWQLQSFAHVHHLVSHIVGQLPKKHGVWELFAHCLPGGSITGAPKKRVLEIIRELEPFNRRIYCGSIFSYGRNGQFNSNIAIRTLLLQQQKLFAWAGGGITTSSIWQEEYDELLAKAEPMLRLMTAD